MRVYVDLDNTIFETSNFPELGEPIYGAKAALEKLREQGHHITIYTTRSCRTTSFPDRRKELLQQAIDHLEKHNIPYDDIELHKGPFDVLIDDRAIQFKDWELALAQLGKFKALDWSSAARANPEIFNMKTGRVEDPNALNWDWNNVSELRGRMMADKPENIAKSFLEEHPIPDVEDVEKLIKHLVTVTTVGILNAIAIKSHEENETAE